MFKNAKIGDEIYAELWGDGVIKDVITYWTYPVCVEFISGCTAQFTSSGYEHTGHVKPSLFYRKGEQRNLTERPESDIDWSKVEPGTKFEFSGGGGIRAFRFFAEGKPWFDGFQYKENNTWTPPAHVKITPATLPPAPHVQPIKMWVK